MSHPLFGADKVEVKMMTTKEEDILTNQSYIENGLVIDRLLESIVIPKIDAQEMFDSDKMAIIIAARIEAYGPDYAVAVMCDACGEVNKRNIDLLQIQDKVIKNVFEVSDHGTVIVELPKSKKVVEFKHILPKSIASIEKSVQKMQKLKINTNFTSEFFKRIIVSLDGDENKEKISSFIDNLRIMDSRFLSLVYNKSLPSLDTSFKARCDSCGHESEGGLPIQANFFFPEF